MVGLAQILAQQRGCPYRGVIAQVARILVQDRVEQGIDDPLHGGGPSASGSVLQAFGRWHLGPPFKTADPIVNRLAGDAQFLAHLSRGVPLFQQH